MGSLAKQLRFVFLGTVLVVAAFSTGIPFLFFLVYLLGGLLLASWLYARRGLQGLRAGYHVLNPRAAGGRGAAGRLPRRQRDWLGQAMGGAVERLDPAGAPAGPGDRGRLARQPAVAGQGHAAAPWLVSGSAPCAFAPATRSASSASEMVVGQPTWVVVFPKVHELPHWRLPPSPVDGTAPSRRGSRLPARWSAASGPMSMATPSTASTGSQRPTLRAAREGVRPGADRRPVADARPGAVRACRRR